MMFAIVTIVTPALVAIWGLTQLLIAADKRSLVVSIFASSAALACYG